MTKIKIQKAIKARIDAAVRDVRRKRSAHFDSMHFDAKNHKGVMVITAREDLPKHQKSFIAVSNEFWAYIQRYKPPVKKKTRKARRS